VPISVQKPQSLLYQVGDESVRDRLFNRPYIILCALYHIDFGAYISPETLESLLYQVGDEPVRAGVEEAG
jgi:hypothetical protein